MVVQKVVSPIVVVFPESSFSRNRRRSPGIVVVIPELSYSRTRRRFLRIPSGIISPPGIVVLLYCSSLSHSTFISSYLRHPSSLTRVAHLLPLTRCASLLYCIERCTCDYCHSYPIRFHRHITISDNKSSITKPRYAISN